MIKIERTEAHMLVAMEHALTMALGDFQALRDKYDGTETGVALDVVYRDYTQAIERFKWFASLAAQS